MLPLNFAKWQLVYYYKKWSDLEQFDLLLSKLREHVRVKKGQSAQASLGILDSQSVRWGNNKALNSFDGNKKVKGIKRSEDFIFHDKQTNFLTINYNQKDRRWIE